MTRLVELARAVLLRHKYRGPHLECGYCTDQLGNGVQWPCETARLAIAIIEEDEHDGA